MVAVLIIAAVALLPSVAQAQACLAGWSRGDRLSGTDGQVNAVAALPGPAGGEVIVGGLFTVAGGERASNIARDNPGSDCRADFDCLRLRGIDDIFISLNAWFASDPRANMDGVNGRTIDDIFVFLSLLFGGC